MDSMAAFAMGQAAKAMGKKQRVFDWDKAAQLLRERNATEAEAGLSGDWDNTGGAILRDGKPVPQEDTYIYLSSNWAPPMLEIGGWFTECWRYAEDTPGWDAHTYWPESALAILRGEEPPTLDAVDPHVAK